MRKFKSLLSLTVFMSGFAFYSCQKSIDLQPGPTENPGNSNEIVNDLSPYRFERINKHNFYSQGWKEQQVNIIAGATVFSTESDHVEIVCGPDNDTDPRLIKGAVTMNLPTGADPTLRRIRLRKGGYSGTLLTDLTEIKYSTYVVHNAPSIIVLQIDINNDETKDLNIFFEPRAHFQGTGFPPLVFNTWQQWDALNGIWYVEAATIPGLPIHFTISELTTMFPAARIIDTAPVGHNGEGVRFTIGGTPRSDYDNTIGYFDALIIGTRDKPVSTLYDFTCSQ